MNIRTSCFDVAGRHLDAIAISVKVPVWYQGPHFPQLFPALDWVRAFHRGTLGTEGYTHLYNRFVLESLKPKTIAKAVDGKILLCWEPAGEFCHRRLVASWLETNLGIVVPEWEG